MILVQPITSSSKRRAVSAGLYGQRCTIDNLSKNKPVHLVHVLYRDFSTNDKRMDSVEWTWRMRKNTLNLDTRHNTFFLGSLLYDLYKEMRWVLLPDVSIVDQYFDEIGFPLLRDEFPIIDEPTFKYTFLPIKQMEDIPLLCQDTETISPTTPSFTVHLYPFDTIPTITSHIHPTYAILHIGRALAGASSSVDKNSPVLRQILMLCSSWMEGPPDDALPDPSFISPEAEDDESCSDSIYEASDGDSVSTPPRRIPFTVMPPPCACQQNLSVPIKTTNRFATNEPKVWTYQTQPNGTSLRRIMEADQSSTKRSGDSLDKPEPPSSDRQCFDILTHTVLSKQAGQQQEGNDGWTTDRISDWARSCSPSPLASDVASAGDYSS